MFFSPGHLIKERTLQGAARHANRAFYYEDIVLGSLQIGLFESVRGIAFMCCHKTRAHLYTGCTHLYETIDIMTSIDSPGCNNRDRNTIFFFIGVDRIYDLPDQIFHLKFRFFKVLGLKTQMATGLGTFHYEGVRETAIMFLPPPANESCSPA